MLWKGYQRGEGCSYLLNVSSSIDSIRAKIQKKRISTLLGNAMDTLRGNDEYYRIACQAMAKYSSTNNTQAQLLHTNTTS
jgi:hypothetical protein